MKKATRRPLILSVICVCVLILLLASVSIFNAFAESMNRYVAEVNSQKYENYADAWAAVSNGGEITMLGDWTISKVLTVNENKTVTVNMNGYMINRGLDDDTGSGQVFLVKTGAVLNIKGDKNSENEHVGTIQADVWHYNQKGSHVIRGALITGGYNSNGGGAIHIQNNAQVNITNVTIAGNVSTDGSGAGAIRLQGENSKLTVTDSKICYNKATDDGGGAIVVKGKNASAKIVGTIISNNIVTCNSGGGAIKISSGTVSIEKSSTRVSEILFNSTAKHGGAIYISDGSLSIDESTLISRNSAGKEGGAIYVDSGADAVNIRGIYSGNTAKEKGGAVYVNSSVSGDIGARISNAEFFGNSSSYHGGAIFVDSDNNISLSGKVIANGNSPNGLYIQNSGAIVSNSLTEGSRVGIATSWDAGKSAPITTSNYKYFVSDKQGYDITGEGNSLYYVAAATGAPESITVGNASYPVHKGTFRYYPNSGGEHTGYYFYSDGYFVEPARYYNEHLATMSTCVAVAAVNSLYDGEHTDYKAARNIIDVLEGAGFKAMYINYPEPEFFGEDSEKSENLATIGYIIASKQIEVNGESVTLIAIAVRGGKYGAEWASNVVLGDGIGEAKGFDDAADQVEAGIYKYLEVYEIDGANAKFWITGFSRAAATSNLVAKRLTDLYGEDDIYAYCFETPKGGVYNLLKEGMTYSNIHNVVNATDIVPFVGTTEMGFIRYGVDHMLPSYKVGTDEYKAQKDKMLPQLAAIAPDAAFNDYFHEATVSYILFTIQSKFSDKATLIKEESYPEFYTAADWNPYLVERMQKYSLTNDVKDSIYNKDSVNWNGYRNYWSTYKWYIYEDSNGDLLLECYETAPDDFDSGKYAELTLEESISTVMNFYFTLDDAKKNDIISAIDLEAIQKKVEMKDIYSDIIGEWNGFSIDEKNTQFNKYWNAIDLEASLADVLTDEEMDTLKPCLFVILDFGLDFVGDDYDSEEQDLVGTLAYNMSSIMQTHNYEILCAWARSYDSFYASGDLVAPPIPPKVSLEGGNYNNHIIVQLYSENNDAEIYYTLDGTTPSAKNGDRYRSWRPIILAVEDGSPKMVTLKAVAVHDGLVSEVVTQNYILNTNAEMDIYEDAVRVYNFTGSAYLVLAEYDGELLQGIEYFAVKNNDYFFFEDSSLNFENKVVAHLIRNFDGFKPLCDSVCVTDPTDKIGNIHIYDSSIIEIQALEIKQAENPELINVSFKTNENTADALIVALYCKDSQSDFNNVVYFNQIDKSEDDTYTFTIERSRLKEMLRGGSVNNSSLVLAVTTNGVSETNTKETVYKETVYTITYHLYGGINSSKNYEAVTEFTEAFFLSNPTREHYEFVAWYDNSSFEGSPVWAIPAGTSENIELYAKWQPFNYTVVYGDGVDGVEIFRDVWYGGVYGSKTPIYGGTPHREGYTFVGWDKEISPTIEGDVRYDAVWVKNHVHEPSLINGADATCFAPGYRSYFECADCGYFEDEECLVAIVDVELWKQTDGRLTVEHTFTEKIQDTEHLVAGTGTNCRDATKYYYGCADCDAIGAEVWVSDTYGDHNIDTGFTSANGQHYHVCMNEGCDYITGIINCSGGVATCQERAKCAVCGSEYGEMGGHTPAEDDGDCTTAIVCSVCGEEITPAESEHKDADGDGKCDACGHDVPTAPDTETETKSETDTDTDTETKPETDTETDTDTGAETDIETEIDTGAVTDAVGGTETEHEPGIGTTPGIGHETEDETEDETERETERETEGETEGETENVTKPVIKPDDSENSGSNAGDSNGNSGCRKGCKSSMSIGTITVAAIAVMSGVALIKKKNDE